MIFVTKNFKLSYLFLSLTLKRTRLYRNQKKNQIYRDMQLSKDKRWDSPALKFIEGFAALKFAEEAQGKKKKIVYILVML